MRDLGISSVGSAGLGGVGVDDLICVASKEFVANGKDHAAFVTLLVQKLRLGG